LKCPLCEKKYQYKKDMIHHINIRHQRQLPENMSAAKFLFASTHGGRTTGSCRICGNETEFDEQIGRPAIFCKNPKCKETFAKIAQSRNIKKYGVPHLLNNQEHQMYMLSRRKISGEYLWSDGRTKVPYVGSYEKKLLEFLDNIVDINPKYIHSPCPFTIYYEYEGETHAYTPDFYIDILDLIIEVKHGGDNPNKHHKIQAVDVKKDKAKEEAVKNTTNHNYIKIVDNKFGPLLRAMFKLIEDKHFEDEKRLFVINESFEIMETQSLAALRPISTNFIGEEEDGFIQRPFYISVYHNIDTDDYKMGVSLDESGKDIIVYHNDKFKRVNLTEFISENTVFSIYKYIGTGNPLNDYKELIEEINKSNSPSLPYGSDVEAFTNVFRSIFLRPSYNIGKIITYPDFIKVSQGKIEVENKQRS